jgi:hypothetical protein
MTDGTILISNNDQTIGIRFGMQAIMAITTEGILDIEAKGDSDKAFVTTSAVVKMAYHGYLNWCLWEDVKPEFDKKRFLDFFDDATAVNMDIYSNVVKAFEESKVLTKMKESQKKMSVKKKR